MPFWCPCETGGTPTLRPFASLRICPPGFLSTFPLVLIDTIQTLCIVLCMATKTLSVDEEAYRKLVQARRHSRESFSKVIKRARWDDKLHRCGDLLDCVQGVMKQSEIERLQRAQIADQPTADKWNDSFSKPAF